MPLIGWIVKFTRAKNDYLSLLPPTYQKGKDHVTKAGLGLP